MAGNVKNKYAYLDQLSTAQLSEILNADANSAEPNDPDMILHILDTIQRREAQDPSGLFPDMDVDQAWREFQEYYNIPEGDDISLYPENNPKEDLVTHVEKSNMVSPSVRKIRYIRRVGLVVAVVAIVFATMVVAQAMGVDVFGALARWTDDIFRFEPSAASVNPELTEALDTYHMDAGLMPTWSPEGFVPEELICDDLRSGKYITQTFCHEDGRSYVIEIVQYSSPDVASTAIYQKDDGNVIEYASNGRRVYIFSNLEHNTATWTDGLFGITIGGDLTQDELKQLFDSIGGT